LAAHGLESAEIVHDRGITRRDRQGGPIGGLRISQLASVDMRLRSGGQSREIGLTHRWSQ
jgi:hypothetical protein